MARRLVSSAPPVQPTQTDGGGILGTIADIFTPRTKGVMQDISASLVARGTQRSQEGAMQSAEQLSEMAMQERDSQKRKEMLRQANQIFAEISGQAQAQTRQFTPRVKESPPTRAVGAAGEIGSFLVPVGAGVKGMAKAGAIAGGIYGATSPEAKTLPERIKTTIGGAVGGGVTGGTLGIAGKAIGKVIPKPNDLIMQIFKPSLKETSKLRKYHKADFADLVIKKDLPQLVGKKSEDILGYYTNKVESLENAADQFLSKFKKTIKKDEILNIVDKGLGGREKRVLQSGAKAKLQTLRDDVVKLYKKDIDLVTTNQIKRDIQNAAKEFYTNTGEPSPQSEALGNVATNISNLIESRARGFKKVNTDIVFYHTANDALTRRLDTLSKREASRLTDVLLSGGLISGLMGNWAPLFVIGGVKKTSDIMRTPQFRLRAAQLGEKMPSVRLPEVAKRALTVGGGRVGTTVMQP